MTNYNSQKKVSINILTWNSEKEIAKCIETCLEQKNINYEINVIDNRSSDETINIIEKYAKNVNIIISSKNYGYAKGHNLGIKRSTGEYILILNPDVYLNDSYVENLVTFLDKNPDYGGAIGKIYQMHSDKDEGGSIAHPIIDTAGLTILRSRQFIAKGYGQPDNIAFDRACEVFGVDGMAPLYRRKMLEDIKVSGEYFDESFFAYCEDQDLSWRARLLSWKFYFVPQAKAYHKRTWKPNTLKARKLLMPEIRKMALRNHYLMIIKNDYGWSILRNILFIGFRATKIFIYTLLFERTSLGAISDIIHLLPTTYKKRKIIMMNRRVSRIEIEKWFGK
jgi:GT2 family glycosyltransferase